MKYISRGVTNEIIFKLNETPVNLFSGTYLFICKHIQTNNVVQLILTDESPVPNTYQKFIISSGDSLNFQPGQYELQIYDTTASTVLITEEYFTVYLGAGQGPIIFMSSGGTEIIYNTTGYTTIPDIPQQFNGFLLLDGISAQLSWQMGIPNAFAFELWRKKTSGGTYIALGTNIQSYIYIDKYLDYSTDYFYKVRGKNNIGYSAFSGEIEITTSTLTGSTGTTSIHIIGSGLTTTKYISGSTWIIFSTGSTGQTQNFVGSGETQVIKSGDTYIIYTPTDIPTPPIVLIGSGLTQTHSVSGNTWIINSMGNTGSTGGDVYTGATPAAITVGGIVAGEVLTGKTYTQLFQDLLVPTLYPTLTNPSNGFSSPLASLYEIASQQTFSTTASFNRGSINPAYGTNGFRSGLPNRYNYTGAQLPATFTSTATSNIQNIVSYVILQGNQSWTSSVRYDAGQQPKDSKGGNYNTPLASGTTGSQTIGTEGVYPIFATTVTIGVFTKQALQSMINANNIVYAVVPETGGNKQSFELPQAWNFARPLIGIQTYNTVSSQWEYQGGTAGTSLTYWTRTSSTETIQGNVINYWKYVYNGVDRSAVQIKLVF